MYTCKFASNSPFSFRFLGEERDKQFIHISSVSLIALFLTMSFYEGENRLPHAMKMYLARRSGHSLPVHGSPFGTTMHDVTEYCVCPGNLGSTVSEFLTIPLKLLHYLTETLR
jgi:hypothetical protein